MKDRPIQDVFVDCRNGCEAVVNVSSRNSKSIPYYAGIKYMRHLIRPPKSEGYPTVVTTELSNRASSFIHSSEAGFSLIEAAVAMVVILVAMLGVFFAFTYAINYNAGNSSRVKVLAILQREVERMRS